MHPKRHIYLPLCYVFPSGELVQIMMATANENLSAKFCNRVLKFFTKLFQLSKLYITSFTLKRIKTCLKCIVLTSWHLNVCYIFIDVLFTNAALIFFIKQENSINREKNKKQILSSA